MGVLCNSESSVDLAYDELSDKWLEFHFFGCDENVAGYGVCSIGNFGNLNGLRYVLCTSTWFTFIFVGGNDIIWCTPWVRLFFHVLRITLMVMNSQVISGQIVQNLGIEYTFGISAVIYVPIVLGMYFLAPETAYNRHIPNIEPEMEPEEKATKIEELDIRVIELELPERKETFRQSLVLFRGRIGHESFWKLVLKPIPLITFPAVLFSTIVYGSFFTWLLSFSIISVTIFGAPPYNLTPGQIGLTNLPLLAVGLIGSPLSGWLADWLAKYIARQNKGVYEPEFRLLLMIPAVVLSTIGFVGFGFAVQQGASIAYPLYFMSMHSLSIPFASSASFTYVIDCHPLNANQAFVTINFAKAVFTFIASTYVNAWLASVGPQTMFAQIAGLNLGLCLLTVPMYVYGKRFRSMIARSPTLRNI